MIHTLKGPHFNYVFEEGGKMFVRHMCDCGCIDKRWEIKEHDLVIAENRVLVCGNLKNIEIVSSRATFGTKNKSANLHAVRIYSPELYKNKVEQSVSTTS